MPPDLAATLAEHLRLHLPAHLLNDPAGRREAVRAVNEVLEKLRREPLRLLRLRVTEVAVGDDGTYRCTVTYAPFDPAP